MKRLHNDQQGFELVTVAVIIVVVALVAFAGFRINANRTKKNSTQTASQEPSVPASIKSQADLQKASDALDAQQPDKQLDTSTLDKNITDLL